MNLNYRILGEGEPLIILHGVFGSADNWQTVGKKFAESYKVFLVDQRNHGNSFHADEFNYDVMANDIKVLIENENLEKVRLLGHSMGGKTAMKFSCLYPELVEKLVVVDISPKVYPPHHQLIFDGFKAVQLNSIKSRSEADQQMNLVIKDFGVKLFLLKNLKRTKEGFEWKVNLSVIERNIEEVGKGLEPEEFFNGETLFIGGGDSDYITEKDHALIKKHFSKASIKMIPGAGHWVHAAKPDELIALTIDFLN